MLIDDHAKDHDMNEDSEKLRTKAFQKKKSQQDSSAAESAKRQKTEE